MTTWLLEEHFDALEDVLFGLALMMDKLALEYAEEALYAGAGSWTCVSSNRQ